VVPRCGRVCQWTGEPVARRSHGCIQFRSPSRGFPIGTGTGAWLDSNFLNACRACPGRSAGKPGEATSASSCLPVPSSRASISGTRGSSCAARAATCGATTSSQCAGAIEARPTDAITVTLTGRILTGAPTGGYLQTSEQEQDQDDHGQHRTDTHGVHLALVRRRGDPRTNRPLFVQVDPSRRHDLYVAEPLGWTGRLATTIPYVTARHQGLCCIAANAVLQRHARSER
jgi:hypothetical protein